MITNVFKSLLFGLSWSVVVISVSAMAGLVFGHVVTSDSWLLQVGAAAVLIICIVVFGCYKYKLLKAEQEWDFDDDDNDDDAEEDGVLEISAPLSNPRPIINVLAQTLNHKALLAQVQRIDDEVIRRDDLTDPVLMDMRSEEEALCRRLIGALEVVLSDEFKGWSDADRAIMLRQVYAMSLYHRSLFHRCLRFGVVEMPDDMAARQEV